jgi:hypothetical protein
MPGMLYRVADAKTQGQFAPFRAVLKAAAQMMAGGLLHPDSDPVGYADSIRQYALWAKRNNWDMKKFGEAWLDVTKKNVLEQKQVWTKPMEDTLRGLIPNRWQDIAAVLARAENLARSAGSAGQR